MSPSGEQSFWFRLFKPSFLKGPKKPSVAEEYSLLILAGMFTALAGVLATIDPPDTSLSDFVQKAERAQCKANLQQMASAFKLYARRYQGRLPSDGNPPTLVGSLRLLRRHHESPAALYCRGDQRPEAAPAGEYETLSVTNISYTYVPFVSWAAGTGFGDTNKIVLLDRIHTGKKADKWPVTGNHGASGGFVLHADGRVEFYQELPADLTDDKGRRFFLSP